MTDVMISSKEVKDALVRVKEKMMQEDISELTKAHVLDALYKALYEVITIEEAASRRELNKWRDKMLGIEGEENADDRS